MKILYIVTRPLEINTSASIRNRATIMGLLENGNDVELVTTQPDSNHSAFDGSMNLSGIKNITYIKLNGFQSVARVGRKFNIPIPIKKMILNILNARNVYDNYKSIINHISEIDFGKFDIIISSSDPKSSHLFVKTALEKINFAGKWIQIWGDPFLSDITLESNNSKKKLIYKEEKELLSACDRIIYVSKMTLNEQKKLYPAQANKMKYIPIPYLEKIVEPIRCFKNENKIKIAYCGDYNSNVRNIIPLYNVLQNEEKIEITICGNSDLNLQTKKNIKILGRQSYEMVEKIEKDADILIHISNLHGSQIPGKIYQYSGTNKPILFILDGEADAVREQFEKFERYYFAENNIKSITETIKNIINENKTFEPLVEFSKKQIAQEIIQE